MRNPAKHMNTKGAGAEGARPLCGAAEGRPHIFRTSFAFGCIFDAFSMLVGVSAGLPVPPPCSFFRTCPAPGLRLRAKLQCLFDARLWF